MKQLLDFIKVLSQRDKKNLIERNLKLLEEAGELAKQILPFGGAYATNHRFATSSKILEEVADCFLVLYSIAYHANFTDEEIEEEMRRKSLKWQSLQSLEERCNYPLPYEIHITISSIFNIDKFKFDCQNLNVKPIILDLHLNNNDIIKDVMTSSVYFGNNHDAYIEMKRISDKLKEFGYTVIREKIETVPWHPAAPTNKFNNHEMPKNCYFESHLNVVANVFTKEKLKDIANAFDAHLSNNVFKKIDDDRFTIMITLRYYNGVFEDFRYHLDLLIEELKNNDFIVEKEIVEFSIFDTKVSHDVLWIGS